MSITKKIIAIVIALTVFSMVGSPVLALTAEELQAQITALLAQLTALQTQLATLQGGTGAVTCAITSFTSNLLQGSTGEDVKCLQKILNSSADTQVAATGVGSPGAETTYFGSLTKAAVIKFQEKYAATILTPLGLTSGTGFVGAATRSKLNPMLVGGYVPPTGCTTDANCATGYMCSAGTCVLKPTGGKEGTYTVALAAIPVSATVYAGNDIPVYGIKVRAYNSAITIARLDLQMSLTVGVTTYSPATLVTAISIYDGANLLTKITNPVFTLDSSSVYYTQVVGFNFLVPEGTEKTLTVKVDTVTAFDTNRALIVNVYGSGIRGVDGAGLSTYSTLATTRQFTIQRLGASTLTGSASVDLPASNNIEIKTTGIENVSLLKFNLKSTLGDSTLTKLSVNVTTAGSAAVPSVIKLYDGDTLFASADPSTGVGVFENFSLAIPKDTTKAMTVKADFSELTASGSNQVNANIPTSGATSQYRSADGSISSTTIASAITANPQFLYEQGVKFTFISGTNTVSTSTEGFGAATGTLKFKVEPFGGTLTKFTEAEGGTGAASKVTVNAYISDGTTTYATGVTRVIAVDPNTDTPDGGAATVTVTLTATDDGSTNPGLMRFKIGAISWVVGDITSHQFSGPTAGSIFDNWVTNYADLR
jgi:hypothetical protein